MSNTTSKRSNFYLVIPFISKGGRASTHQIVHSNGDIIIPTSGPVQLAGVLNGLVYIPANKRSLAQNQIIAALRSLNIITYRRANRAMAAGLPPPH